jgi:hypothetical protein
MVEKGVRNLGVANRPIEVVALLYQSCCNSDDESADQSFITDYLAELVLGNAAIFAAQAYRSRLDM